MFNIDTLKINDGDSLLVNFAEGLSVSECQDAIEYLNKNFPNNKIIGIPYGLIDNLMVLAKTNDNNYPF